MNFLSRLRDRLFEILVVAAPGDWLSRGAGIALAALIVANAAAQALARLWAPPEWGIYLLWFERGSLVLFALEYLARLWAGHADGARESSASRPARLVHPLMLIDLAVLLAGIGGRWWALDLRALRLLRLPDLVYRIRRTWTQPDLAEGQASAAQALTGCQRELAAARAALGETAQQQLAEVRGSLQATAGQIRRVQQRWLLHARRDPTQARTETAATKAQVDELLDELAEQLTAPERLERVRAAARTAYETSAAVYAALPEVAGHLRDLRWRGRQSCRPVPLRSIGQHHFDGLAFQWEGAAAGFARAYEAGVREGMDGLRSAVGYLFEQAESHDAAALAGQLQVGFQRAVNRCRDLDEPAREAWASLQWDLEAQHIDRHELVVTDVARFGRIEFHVARLGRGISGGLQTAAGASQHGLYHLGPAAWRRLRALYTHARNTVVPVLERIGILRPPAEEVRQQAEEARLESVLERGLPEDYLTHFRFEPLADESLMVGFDEELADIDRAIQRWEDGLTSSFVLCGPRGGGKTSLLNVACSRLFEDDALVHRNAVTQKISTPGGLTAYLSRLLDVEVSPGDFEGLSRVLLEGPRRAVLLEGGHNLFLRRIGGLDAVRQLLWLVARTNHHVLWGLCLDENARGYLGKWLPFDRLFHFDIRIQPWAPVELRRLILQRHNLSGYRLRWGTGPGLERALRRRVGRYRRVEEPAVQDALAALYFQALAETCRDNTMAALYYWLRSLDVAGRDACTVQPLAALELDLVRDLSMDAAFALAAVLQHDNLTADELAGVVDSDAVDARLELEILWNLNILECDVETNRFRINAVALKPVRAMLEGRNLID